MHYLKSLAAALMVGLFSTGALAQGLLQSHLDRAWPNTDFSKSSIDYLGEVQSGGPGKDGIPAINDPKFTPVGAEDGLSADEPVLTVELDGITRAYPLRYLIWHEIVNDRFGDVPVTVTYCPLCNSGLVFDGRLDGRELTFGVSGNLRNSDMVMYDHQTESWWQQFIGEGIVGEFTGAKLNQIPGWIESWQSFAQRNPNGQVLTEPNYRRQYGRNPYVFYDTARRPFLYDGEDPPNGVAPLERVVVVENQAWPLSRLAKEQRVVENGVALEWVGEVASALDQGIISQGRKVGQIRVRDANSGADIPHDIAFAFAFHAFFPDGEWLLGQ